VVHERQENVVKPNGIEVVVKKENLSKQLSRTPSKLVGG